MGCRVGSGQLTVRQLFFQDKVRIRWWLSISTCFLAVRQHLFRDKWTHTLLLVDPMTCKFSESLLPAKSRRGGGGIFSGWRVSDDSVIARGYFHTRVSSRCSIRKQIHFPRRLGLCVMQPFPQIEGRPIT